MEVPRLPLLAESGRALVPEVAGRLPRAVLREPSPSRADAPTGAPWLAGVRDGYRPWQSVPTGLLVDVYG